MICYICHKHTTNSFTYKGIGFGYCQEHGHEIQKGVAKFILTGSMNYIIDKKKEFYYKDNQLEITLKNLNIDGEEEID